MPTRKLISFLKKNNNFLLTTHTNMEGDALGSTLGLYRLLKRMGKKVSVVCDDDIPYGYDFLPDTDKVERLRWPVNIKFDVLVVLDCSDLSRCGQIRQLDLKNKCVLNIDHHISNTGFGDINWVEPLASSASEMVYLLYKKMGASFDKEAAMLLYVGILTDTGSFRYTNTGVLAHKACAELISHGLDVSLLHRELYENIPFEDMKLLFKILPAVKRSAGGRITWFEVRQGLLRNKKVSFDLSEHILSFARSIKGVEVVALFKENLGMKNQIRVNLRSQGKTDVNKIAQAFGGGGHRTAAGATINGKLQVVRKKVLEKIKKSLV